MNDSTLQTIASDISIIMWVVIGFTVLVSTVILSAVTILIIGIRNKSRDYSSRDSFKYQASELLDKGEIDKLVELSQKVLNDYPDHEYANYYLAISYYRNGNVHESYRVYKKLKMLKPGWSEEHINPYLKELEVKIKNIKPEIIKQ